jgi:flagellar hook protein FlgE
MFAGVAGSRNHQLKMDVIGNNISNINTIGYKSSRMSFQEAFAQTLKAGSSPTGGTTGGTNPAQVGLGTRVRSIDVVMTQGSLEGTDRLTDLAIDGEGFFVLTDGVSRMYSRDGSFDIDGEGYVVSPGSGWKVMGWRATDGKIDASQPIETLRLMIGESMTAKATDSIRYRGNLNAESSSLYSIEALDTAVVAGTALLDAARTAVAGGGDVAAVLEAVEDERSAVDGAVEAVMSAVAAGLSNPAATADDIVGAAQAAAAGNDVALDMAAAAADLVASVPGITALDVAKLLSDTATTVKGTTEAAVNAAISAAAEPTATSEKVKDTVGDVLDSVNASLAAARAVPSDWATQTQVYDSQGVQHNLQIRFYKVENNKWVWRVSSPGATGEGVIRFQSDGQCDRDYALQQVVIDPANGADLIMINIDFTNVSQFGAGSNVTDAMVNGFPSGTLESFKIDPDGTITGIYSNQQNEVLGQIVLAKFTNPAGLSREGSNLYAETPNSGSANVGAAEDGGRGSIISGSVEMSNVDLAREFTDLIITLRGFQANARLITTAEEMLQELIQLKR